MSSAQRTRKLSSEERIPQKVGSSSPSQRRRRVTVAGPAPTAAQLAAAATPKQTDKRERKSSQVETPPAQTKRPTRRITVAGPAPSLDEIRRAGSPQRTLKPHDPTEAVADMFNLHGFDFSIPGDKKRFRKLYMDKIRKELAQKKQMEKEEHEEQERRIAKEAAQAEELATKLAATLSPEGRKALLATQIEEEEEEEED